MSKIICDTNIWYHIAQNQISLNNLNDFDLIATYINICEFTTSPNVLSNIELVRKATIAAFDNHKFLFSDNSWVFLLKLDNPNFNTELSGKNEQIFELSKQIALGLLPIESVYRPYIKDSKKRRDDISNEMNKLFDYYKQQAKGNKKELRDDDIIPIVKIIINEMVENWTYQHLGNKVGLSENFNWGQVDLFLKTLAVFFEELILSKMRFNSNDLYDFLNLVYVGPNDKYWTKEKRWIKIIREKANLGEYLFNENDL